MGPRENKFQILQNEILRIKFDLCLHKKLSLVLLQMTNYVYSS